MNPYLFDAAILAALAFAIYQLTMLGKATMTTQDAVDAIAATLGKVYIEVTSQADSLRAEIAAVQAQLDAANVPAEVVDLTALTAAAQKLDDIVADAPVEVPVENAPVEDAPADPPVDA